jgi:outer membrane biosynthesis protein TonB
MDVYIYTEGTRKVKGEEEQFLRPLAELEDFDSIDAALEALVDEAPDLIGTEFVIFTCAPEYITVDEPTSKYSFKRRSEDEEAAEEEPEAEEEAEEEEPEEEEPEEEQEEEEDEEEEPAPAPRKKSAAKKGSAQRSAKKASARKPPAKRSASKAGTRTGSSKRTPFTRNPASAE